MKTLSNIYYSNYTLIKWAIFIPISSLIFNTTCQKKVSSPDYNSPFDETSSAYVPTPGLNTAPITSITALAAITGGVFENNYGKPATSKGVCWSLVENPTLTSSCTNEGPGTSSFTSSLVNLLPDTLYYVRAYATNEAGTIYGGQRNFRTRDGIAVFGEAKVMSVLAKSATFYAVVTSDGSAPITRKGFVWATRAQPSLQDSVVSFAGGLGSATHPLSNLRPGLEYHVRAYTESAARVTYSVPVVFTTQTGQPIFSNLGITGVTSSGSTVSVTIDSDGGDALTARGVCYSKEPDPTVDDTCIASGSGMGTYSISLIGLDRATVYYLRPYAINSVMTGYGAQASFVTAAVLPSVETGIASLIGATSATVSGNVTSDGGSPQTTRGICYATTQNPTTANTCVASGTGAGAFEAALTGMAMGTIYYARSYATNPIGTAYGSQISFTTLTGPTVTTGAVSNLSSTGATIAGNVSADGGSTVTARGVCYSTSQNPSTTETCVASGSGIGAFSGSLSGLSLGTTYYARAYATNTVATSYGSQVSLTTHDVPMVTTGAISAITSTSATVAGNVTAAGGVTVTARGICYSTSQNPTTAGTCIASGSGTGSFTAALSGLTYATTYYVRAYATNSVGTTYGAQSTFTTLAVLPTVTTGSITNITASGATIAGNVTASGGATVTARGVCYSTSQNPTTSGTCVASGSGSGMFEVTVSSLAPATTYYVRSYATNPIGTSYGGQVSVTTLTSVPLVSTVSASNITWRSVTLTGNVLSTNGLSVTTRGVCISKEQNPTLDDLCSQSGSGLGVYSVNISNLESGTSFFARAFATNSAGTSYGSQISFSTTSGTGVMVDNDGNSYPTVQIGTQVWMAANLRSTSYRDGTHIPNVVDGNQWSGLSTGAWSHYGNEPSNNMTYGKLYNLHAVQDRRGLCPVGWHVPTDTDWQILIDVLGGDAVAGAKMKSNGTDLWLSPNTGATNESGFTGHPGGWRRVITTLGVFGDFQGIGTFGNWWSSTSTLSRYLGYGNLQVIRNDPTPARFGLSVRCLKDDGVASLTTNTVGAIGLTTATSGGNITNDGGSNVLSRGLVWSTFQNPTVQSNNGLTVNGSGYGVFSSSMTGLTPGSQYYVRAYATNSSGTAYGNQLSFTTLGTAPVTDIDGNVYPTVQIGTQVWMASNLKTSRYRNETIIYNVTSSNTWSIYTIGAWANYDNNTENEAIYGKLYNWYAVANTAGLCPAGWHVPTDEEWTVLSIYLESDVGIKLKSTSGWGLAFNGSNTSGFSGLPAGGRDYDGTFFFLGRNGYFWSSTAYGTDRAYNRYLSSGVDLGRFLYDMRDGFSVRCLRD